MQEAIIVRVYCRHEAEKVAAEEVLRDLVSHIRWGTGRENVEGFAPTAWNSMGAFVMMEKVFKSVSMAIQTVFKHTTNLDESCCQIKHSGVNCTGLLF